MLALSSFLEPAMPKPQFPDLKVARTIQVFHSFAEAEEAEKQAYWAMSPRKRLEALELMRQLNHADYDPTSEGFSRVYTITQRAAG